MWIRLARAGSSLILSACLQQGCTPAVERDAGYVPGVTDVTDTPCQSERRGLSWNQETPLGFSTSRLLSILEGLHTQNVVWSSNTKGAIELSLSDLRATFVDERASDGFAAGTQEALCSDYVQVDATLLLSTTDGKLLDIQRPITLRASTAEEAFGELRLDAFTFEGSFEPAPLAGTCFRRLLVKLLLSEGGFAGSLTQEHSRGSCELPDLATGKQLLAGRWGSRWQSY